MTRLKDKNLRNFQSIRDMNNPFIESNLMTPNNNNANIYSSTLMGSNGMKGMYSGKQSHAGSSKQLFHPSSFQLKNFDTVGSHQRGFKQK
jgi:hypothetical protein